MSSPSPSEDHHHYNDTNRAFLQAFLSRSTLTLKEAKPILAAIYTAHDRETLPEDITPQDLHTQISTLNTHLSPFDLEIRSTYPQLNKSTDARIYALVNATSDTLTQLATTHTADEISFVKRVLDAMFETHNGRGGEICAVTSMQAVRLHKNPNTGARESLGGGEDGQGGGGGGQGLTMVQAERLLKALVEEGWFEKSKAGFFTLSPRGLMELRGWLLETYNGNAEENDDGEGRRGDRVKLCFACKEIITIGQRCPNRDCLCRLHDICTGSFFRTQKEKKCPLCKREWTGKDYVGERVVTTSDKYMQGKRRSGFGASQARRGTQGGEEAEEEG